MAETVISIIIAIAAVPSAYIFYISFKKNIRIKRIVPHLLMHGKMPGRAY